MLVHVLEQVLHTVRHVQRSYESLLMVAKSHRDAFLVYVQAGKHIILLWYKCFLPHAECLLVQCLLVPRIVPEHSRLGVDIHHTSLRTGFAPLRDTFCNREFMEKSQKYLVSTSAASRSGSAAVPGFRSNDSPRGHSVPG